MKQWLFLIATILLTLCSSAQTNENVRLKGKLYDDQSNKGLTRASITLLSLKDSSQSTSTYTKEDGSFEIDSLPRGDYYLHVTHLGFKQLLKVIHLRNIDQVVDLGTLILEKKAVELSEISIVANKSQMKISKDTMEFNAINYKLREHAVLEELLTQLPGVQVDKNGVIRINGEIVSLMLVDGKPFFSNDPKIGSKNLQSDIIEKIQLIDRKIKDRDPSTFDAEKTEKAINIILKKSSKNVWAGEIMAGVGPKDHFAIKTNFTRFSDYEQVAVFFNGDNINGMIDGSNSNSMFHRKWNPNINYTKDISNKLTFTGSYFMQYDKIEDAKTTAQQTIVGDTGYYYDQKSSRKENNATYFMNSKLKYKPSASLTITFTNNTGYSYNKIHLTNDYGSYNSNHQPIDSGSMTSKNANSTFILSNQISLEKKFKKKGYSLNFDLSFSNSFKSENNYNSSKTHYLQTDGKYIIDTLDQYNKISNNSRFVQTILTQTMPLSSKITLSASYSLSNSISPYSRSTYNMNLQSNHYDIQVDTLSGIFKNSVTSNIMRIGVESKNGKIDFKMSLYAMLYHIKTDILQADENIKYSAISFIPRGYLNYQIDKNKRFKATLNGSPILPSADQLRPIIENNNPLFIKTGNINLKAGTLHNVSMNYDSYQSSKSTLFSLGLYASLQRNQIINGFWIDSARRQISRPLNIDGAYDIKINADYSVPIKKNESRINTNISALLKRDMSYVNGIIGNNINYSVSQSVSYNYTYKEVLNAFISGNYSYNKATYISPTHLTIHYLSYSFSLNGNINLPSNISIGSNITYTGNAGRIKEFNTNTFLLNTFISKKLLKNRQLQLKLQGFDILNQNVNILRNIGPGYIEDVKINTLNRIFILSFTYYIKQNEINKK